MYASFALTGSRRRWSALVTSASVPWETKSSVHCSISATVRSWDLASSAAVVLPLMMSMTAVALRRAVHHLMSSFGSLMGCLLSRWNGGNGAQNRAYSLSSSSGGRSTRLVVSRGNHHPDQRSVTKRQYLIHIGYFSNSMISASRPALLALSFGAPASTS